mgnify:CR=1 FL=1
MGQNAAPAERISVMNYYFAPMEGITGWVYRQAFHRYFGPADEYFTPFLSPGADRCFTSRELNQVLPENNEGMETVPQLMTRNSEDFIWAARELQKMGYQQVNLNLGCPSGTVTAKGKGSGFLAYPEELDRFLDAVFGSLDMQISIKTRIGKDDPAEFERLLEIFNRYPICRLIIHPRIRQEFYKGTPHMDVFAEAVRESRNPLCYNGDLFTLEDCRQFQKAFPQVDAVMLGRGLLADPFLLSKLPKEKDAEAEEGRNRREAEKKEILAQFLADLCAGYQETMSGERNVLFKLKELWSYLIGLFEDGEKYGKKIRKSQSLQEYSLWTERLLAERPLRKG